MTTFTFNQLALIVALGFIAGCGKSPDSASVARHNHDDDTSKVLLADEPVGAVGVTELREQAKDDEDVILVGRIGGADSPWVDGRSAFAVVDPSIELCQGGVCSCCKDKVCDASALVKVVDEHGHMFKTDARDLLHVKQNELVVVSGKAKRDDAGNLTILASGVYVRR